jgi:hypothetical protein
MKILKENMVKEKMPVSFLTYMLSKSWDEIGNIKDQLFGLDNMYTDAEILRGPLEQLLDSHLIFAGQLEALVQRTGEIEIPDVAPVVPEKDAPVEVLPEDDLGSEPIAIEPVIEPKEPVVVVVNDDELDGDIEAKPEVKPEVKAPVKTFDTDFEYFVDFDDPVGEPITDADLYDDAEEDEDKKKR